MAEIVSRCSFTALPNWIIRKRAEDSKWLSCSEFSVLFALQFFADGTNSGKGVFPSYATICKHANISKQKAIDCIKSLQSKQLIEKKERYGDDGQKTNIYYLKIWNHEPPASIQGAAEVVQNLDWGGQEFGLGGVQNLDWGGQRGGPEQEPMNKKNPKEPPLPPAAQQTPEPLNGERRPAPTTPNQTEPKQIEAVGWQKSPMILPVASSAVERSDSKNEGPRKSGRFVARPADVPSGLSEAAEEVCEFFNRHKGGQHTARAFQGLLEQLALINADECGGIDAVKSQIENAITVSKAGEKKWQSILYKNWCLYGKQEAIQRRGRSYGHASTVNMQTHPSYRPLAIDYPQQQVASNEEFSF